MTTIMCMAIPNKPIEIVQFVNRNPIDIGFFSNLTSISLNVFFISKRSSLVTDAFSKFACKFRENARNDFSRRLPLAQRQRAGTETKWLGVRASLCDFYLSVTWDFFSLSFMKTVCWNSCLNSTIKEIRRKFAKFALWKAEKYEKNQKKSAGASI